MLVHSNYLCVVCVCVCVCVCVHACVRVCVYDTQVAMLHEPSHDLCIYSLARFVIHVGDQREISWTRFCLVLTRLVQS